MKKIPYPLSLRRGLAPALERLGVRRDWAGTIAMCVRIAIAGVGLIFLHLGGVI